MAALLSSTRYYPAWRLHTTQLNSVERSDLIKQYVIRRHDGTRQDSAPHYVTMRQNKIKQRDGNL